MTRDDPERLKQMMATVTRDDAARSAADFFSRCLSGVVRVVRLRSRTERPESPVKFLVVRTHAPGTDPEVFVHPPHLKRGIPYRMAIVEVTPDQFARIEYGQTPVPRGWALGETLFAPAGV